MPTIKDQEARRRVFRAAMTLKEMTWIEQEDEQVLSALSLAARLAEGCLADLDLSLQERVVSAAQDPFSSGRTRILPGTGTRIALLSSRRKGLLLSYEFLPDGTGGEMFAVVRWDDAAGADRVPASAICTEWEAEGVLPLERSGE